MNKIDGKTKILGVIGNPIQHTLSPVIHNTLCELMGINAVYVPIHVENDIEVAVNGLYASSVSGLNITVPYKQDVMKALKGIDPLAEKIGAVNTLVPDDGGYKGYNTDMPGLYRALCRQGVDPDGKEAIVIGAGGASRAVCMMLVTYGTSKIYLINRSFDKAEKIAELSSKIIPVRLSDCNSIPEGSYLMFQCTSLGLKEEDGLLIDDDSFYEKAEFGYDLIYNPPETPFIKKLKQNGVPCDNGLSMLLYQAVIAFEYWFDLTVPENIVEKVWNKLKKEIYGTRPNIVLTGYMGSGKTTVGKKLAERLGMTFIDTDEEIVKREGRTINEIFEAEGEPGFRKIETEVLKSLSDESADMSMISGAGQVISTGGGIVLKKENMPLLKELGKVFYLRADEAVTFNRVKNDSSRPLLKSEDSEELKNRISNMIKERKGYYELTSDIIIETGDKNVDEVVNEIINRFT